MEATEQCIQNPSPLPFQLLPQGQLPQLQEHLEGTQWAIHPHRNTFVQKFCLYVE